MYMPQVYEDYKCEEIINFKFTTYGPPIFKTSIV